MRWRMLARVASSLTLLVVGACGGGGGGGGGGDTDWLYPLWVPTDVAVADVDGDGRSDLAMVIALPRDGYTPNSVLGISLQRPDGTMGPVATMAPQRGLNVARMKVADYDGDGQNDLFACFTPFSTGYNAKLMVMLRGPVRGQFYAPVDTSMRDLKGIDDAVIADLDGDLRPDQAA